MEVTHLRLREEGVSFQSRPGSGTHGDAPSTFAVGFVDVGEALAADKPRLCDQVSSTREHEPEVKDRERKHW